MSGRKERFDSPYLGVVFNKQMGQGYHYHGWGRAAEEEMTRFFIIILKKDQRDGVYVPSCKRGMWWCCVTVLGVERQDGEGGEKGRTTTEEAPPREWDLIFF